MDLHWTAQPRPSSRTIVIRKVDKINKTFCIEIVNIYPSINPPTLTAHQSNRVCNALALLQCVASHPETRSAFLAAHIPLFLYPFLHTVSKTRPFEYLRLTSLGVIGALVKTDEQEVINFLLTTEIIPLCLRIMESGSELSKTVATFILQKILLDDTGLAYICQTYERFSHVAMILVSVCCKDMHGHDQIDFLCLNMCGQVLGSNGIHVPPLRI
uniref:CCR4-NOT transcription complex subunit 9 n=1 Tax=Neolamprologus brichardi TaxID=32507 RepID=A0A3Q4HPQ9_NEOBR